MGRIRVLSAELINQIAAGEVVERPASVVKELAENSVDAGAGTIRIELSGGGLQQIRVIDDGTGMSRSDAVLALERHATSKLVDAAGLFQIFTKGFRGEALPAIASVSRFSLHTSEPQAPSGVRIVVDGGGPLQVEDAPPAGGTRIEVADLFFNVPARRKFLRREQTELVHCEEAVIRLALAHSEVGFFLEHDGRSLLAAPASASDPTERIAAALGPEVHPHLLAVDERRLGVRVTGYVASPEYTQSNARGLYTFVNRRYIRDRGVNFAVQRAFQESLPPGRQPVAVLFLELDPSQVDVNVHPQKLEVRFADARGVQEALIAGISKALKAAPWRQGVEPVGEGVAGAHYALAVDRFLARAQTASGFLEGPPQLDAPALSFGQARPGINEAPPPNYFGRLRFMGELAARFWICEAPGGTLVVIDPRAALERVRLHQLRLALAQGTLATAQPTLFSATIELPAPELARISEGTASLWALGLSVEAFGGSTVAVK
ncbi:MAG: mismatch repair protein MutL, partial [Myxococcaceae bacterium]|nr:mismatch repair protein MutL [Myxococcaceae bacterium]